MVQTRQITRSPGYLRGIEPQQPDGASQGQLPMSLFDEATIRSTLARPRVLTVAWTAFTVRPLSGVLNGSCSLSTSLTTPTLIVVLGATCVGTAITTVVPTAR